MITVKDYEHACELLGLDPKEVDKMESLPEKYKAAAIAHYKLMIITEAANESKPFDYTDISYKYEPRFWVEATNEVKSGVGFSGSHYGTWTTYSGVGSRLCSHDKKNCQDLQKRFEPLYIDLILLPVKK